MFIIGISNCFNTNILEKLNLKKMNTKELESMEIKELKMMNDRIVETRIISIDKFYEENKEWKKNKRSKWQLKVGILLWICSITIMSLILINELLRNLN